MLKAPVYVRIRSHTKPLALYLNLFLGFVNDLACLIHGRRRRRGHRDAYCRAWSLLLVLLSARRTSNSPEIENKGQTMDETHLICSGCVSDINGLVPTVLEPVVLVVSNPSA